MFWPDFLSCDSYASSVFKAWVVPSGLAHCMPTTQWLVWRPLGSELMVHLVVLVLKVFGVLFRVRFMHAVCGEPRGSLKAVSHFSLFTLSHYTSRFPGAPFLSLSIREWGHYLLTNSATYALWLCPHLGPSGGKTEIQMEFTPMLFRLQLLSIKAEVYASKL